MEHFPATLTREESDDLARRIMADLADNGFGLWAVEVRDVAPFIGFVGLRIPTFEAHFTPAVEVGWRLAAENWGKGYATEAGRTSLAFGFSVGLDQIVSFTTKGNVRSRRVMERLGMTRDPRDDFDHPRLDPHDPKTRHVLYRLSRPRWMRLASGLSPSL